MARRFSTCLSLLAAALSPLVTSVEVLVKDHHMLVRMEDGLEQARASGAMEGGRRGGSGSDEGKQTDNTHTTQTKPEALTKDKVKQLTEKDMKGAKDLLRKDLNKRSVEECISEMETTDCDKYFGDMFKTVFDTKGLSAWACWRESVRLSFVVEMEEDEVKDGVPTGHGLLRRVTECGENSSCDIYKLTVEALFEYFAKADGVTVDDRLKTVRNALSGLDDHSKKDLEDPWYLKNLFVNNEVESEMHYILVDIHKEAINKHFGALEEKHFASSGAALDKEPHA